MPRVAVFCGAAAPTDAVYVSAAASVGAHLAEHGVHVVYGGSRLGMMGALADSALAAGAQVTGIIPRSLHVPRIVRPGLSTLITVPDMTVRKARLLQGADAILALPGGFGTLDELAAAWGSAAHHEHAKPIGLLNTDHFYDPLLTFLNGAATAGFLAHHPHLRLENLAVVDTDPAALVDALIARAAPPPAACRTLASSRAGT
ncbi:TIGR00730 family Rossman fold protein [Streptomyces sp. MS2.AVA.5]|uniref:TIGR00730 family Rossman fold protein n=1 Tax=Streptomyces achmelvichensis TaxID=3134111 RepID=A0ACC6Q972_9ACTN